MLKKSEMPYCPVATTLKIIGSKWKILIIQKLELRNWRFNELYKDLNGISKRVLSDNLRSMEQDGILTKQIFIDHHYNHVEYGLNELGLTLIPVLKEMEKWGVFYREYQKCYK